MKKHSLREVPKIILRILGYQLAFGFFGFMFVPALMSAGDWLRIPVLALLLLAAGALFFSDGAVRGERDMAMSETLDKPGKAGAYQPSAQEIGKRYYWPKGVLGALLAAVPVLVMALVVAATAQPYTYTTQDLPTWMGAYLRRPEIGEALMYMRGEVAAVTLPEYLRVAVRFMLFPYVGIFGMMSDDMSLLFDRLSPVLAMIMPTLAAVGYLFGPRRRAKAVKMIEEAKNTPRKRLKKDRNKKGAGPKEKKQLV